MKSKILTIATLLVFTSLVMAKPASIPSVDLIVSGATTSSPVTPSEISNHDFEIVEGFATGLLNGQNGWTTFAASAIMPVIDVTNPSSGGQHMHLDIDNAVAGGTLKGGFSPLLGPQSATEISDVSVDVFVSGGGGANYVIAAQAPSLSLLTWRLDIDWLGTITVLDDTGTGVGTVDTGVTWPVGTYFNIRVVSNPNTDEINYYMDGTLIYTSVGGHFGASTVEQVVLFDDNFQFGETGDFDNLKINTQIYTTPTAVPSLGLYAIILMMLTLLVAFRVQSKK